MKAKCLWLISAHGSYSTPRSKGTRLCFGLVWTRVGSLNGVHGTRSGIAFWAHVWSTHWSLTYKYRHVHVTLKHLTRIQVRFSAGRSSAWRSPHNSSQLIFFHKGARKLEAFSVHFSLRPGRLSAIQNNRSSAVKWPAPRPWHAGLKALLRICVRVHIQYGDTPNTVFTIYRLQTFPSHPDKRTTTQWGKKKKRRNWTLQLLVDCSDTTITFCSHITVTKIDI